MSEKYPRTPHLPWSEGCTRDDKYISDLDSLIYWYVTVTEKLDGSNACLTRDNVFARSHNGPPSHPSFDALKALHANISYLIPAGYEVFGEWCYAKHSIYYDRLPGYFLVFGVRFHQPGNSDSRTWWLSWPSTERVASNLGLHTVPVICDSALIMSEDGLRDKCQKWMDTPSYCGDIKEGIVVRQYTHFLNDDFSSSVSKLVRTDHVTTDDHWSQGPIIQNKLRKGAE